MDPSSTARIRPLLLSLGLVLAAAVVYAVATRSGPHHAAPPPPPPPPPRLKTGAVDPALVKRLAAADTGFGFRLFAKMLDGKPGENVFYSPYSVSEALSMTYNGAAGQTKRDMAATLGIPGLTLDDLGHGRAQIATALQKPGTGVTMRVANSLWAQQGFHFVPDFLRRNTDHFGAEVANVDFGGQPKEAADRINGWVRGRTEGKIDNIVSPAGFSDLTRLVLVNAVYFHGTWAFPFDKGLTQDGPFMKADGQTDMVPLMSRQRLGRWRYLRGDGFQAVRLPYGKVGSADRFAMYVFLPDKADGLTGWLKGLTPERWSGWLKAMEPQPGTVVLPRFRTEYGAEMSQSLKDLGMASAFGSGADFRRMFTDTPAWIESVSHKALLEVDEEGTVAAAATAVAMPAGPGPPPPRGFTMVVDHPFLCAIRDDETGEILFLGAVYDP